MNVEDVELTYDELSCIKPCVQGMPLTAAPQRAKIRSPGDLWLQFRWQLHCNSRVPRRTFTGHCSDGTYHHDLPFSWMNSATRSTSM